MVIVGKFQFAGDGVTYEAVAVKVFRIAEQRCSAGNIENGIASADFQLAEVTCLEIEPTLNCPGKFRPVLTVAFKPGTQCLGEDEIIVPDKSQAFRTPVTIPHQAFLGRANEEVFDFSADQMSILKPGPVKVGQVDLDVFLGTAAAKGHVGGDRVFATGREPESDLQRWREVCLQVHTCTDTVAVSSILVFLVGIFIPVTEIAFPAHALGPGNSGHFLIDLFGDGRVHFRVHYFFRFGHGLRIRLLYGLRHLLILRFQCIQPLRQHFNLLAK